mgnify:CR=1 FL=1
MNDIEKVLAELSELSRKEDSLLEHLDDLRRHQKILCKCGNSHKEEKNLVKSLPSHLRGTKLVEKAIKELYQLEFLFKLKKTQKQSNWFSHTLFNFAGDSLNNLRNYKNGNIYYKENMTSFTLTM